MNKISPGGERKMVSFGPELLYQLNLVAEMSEWKLSEVVHEVAKLGLQTIARDETNPLHPKVTAAEGFVRKEEEGYCDLPGAHAQAENSMESYFRACQGPRR